MPHGSRADNAPRHVVFRIQFLGACVAVVACLGMRWTEAASAEPLPGVPPLPPGIRRVDWPGIHNAFALSTNLYSGSVPETDAAFSALARAGVRTIVSVDGARPDLEAARRHGLRYVHLPHGYDGIGADVQARLIQAHRASTGAVFVHCHHGKHRGPAAAAIMGLGNLGWSTARAESLLVAAGTATNYLGLYEAVRRFEPPSENRLRAASVELPESAKVPDLVAAMVDLDVRWERLKTVRDAGHATPPSHPDLVPAQEALLFREHYRETRRLPEAARLGPEFLDRLDAAEIAAGNFERLLRETAGRSSPETRARLDDAFDKMARDCRTCHATYRDRRGH